MGELRFTFLCFLLSFYAAVEHVGISAAPDPPPQLACNVTKNPDGSATYRLHPTPTLDDRWSSSWANVTGVVFARDGNFSAEVLKLTSDSVTLKLCLEEMIYRNDGETLQEGRCHVNCSGHARTPPSADHRFCVSVQWCPPVWAAVLLLVLLLLVLVLLVLLGYRRTRPRCSRGSEEAPSVKSSSAVEAQLLGQRSPDCCVKNIDADL